MARTAAPAKKATSAEIQKGQREFTAAIQTKPVAHVRCRAMRHAWTQKNVIRLREPQTRRDLPVLIIDFECERGCNVVRHDMLVVRKLGNNQYRIIERLKPTYDRPDDYQIPGIPRGVQPSTILWQEYVRRQAEQIARAEPGDRSTPEP